jgi:probable rRNA maturation factor
MIEINNTTKQKINSRQITFIADKFLAAYRLKKAIVSLAIIGRQKMRRLNQKYRGIDKPTDVLSFSNPDFNSCLSDGLVDNYLGEIVINFEECKNLGKYQELFRELKVNIKKVNIKKVNIKKVNIKKVSSDYLLYFLVVHGLLHLIGLNDVKDAERQEMLARGKRFLAKIGMKGE